MTKDRLAKKIIEMIDNFRFVGDDEKEVLEAVNSMLDSLEPKDRGSFCKWGMSEDRSTPEDCWY